jgi:hypothetical protein
MRRAILIGACLLGACTEDEAQMYPPLDDAELDAECDDLCSYEVGCGAIEELACQDDCHATGGVLRADAARMLVACYVEQACDPAAEALCLADTIDAIDPSREYDIARDACFAGESRCGISYACDASYFVLLADPVLQDLSACFDLGCDAIETCVWDVFNG